MKTKIIFFLALLLADNITAQKNNGNENKKNTIYLEFYQPIQTPSLREFYNDDWMLTPSNQYKRHYFSNSFGISYERVLKNDIILRPRFGMTIRTLKEENHTDKFFNGAEDVTYIEKYDYKQKHINAFLGIAKKMQIVKHFNIDLGVDLAYIQYLNGNTNFYSAYTYYWTDTPDIKGGDEYWWTNKVGKAYCFGIGPIFKPEYVFTNNLSVSLEAQMYFMCSTSKDKSTITSRQRTWFDPAANGGLDYLRDVSGNSETKYDFMQWSWSRLSPLIRIGYKF